MRRLRLHPLYTLVPLLVREAHAERLALRPLDSEAMHALTRARYPLAPVDEARLTTYLMNTRGNPLYTGELLRTLEDEGVLRMRGGLDAGRLAEPRGAAILAAGH